MEYIVSMDIPQIESIKPKSKVVAITASIYEGGPIFYHLCEDGSTWAFDAGRWDMILNSHPYEDNDKTNN